VTRRPARLTAALLGATCALAVSGCAGTAAREPAAGGSSSSTTASTATGSATAEAGPESRRIEVTVAGGRVDGGADRVPVAAGTPVTLVVTSDVADEVHVHGYEVAAALVAAQPTELTFDADVPGVFEVELHDAGTVLLTLQVQ
jgi:plastocyanin